MVANIFLNLAPLPNYFSAATALLNAKGREGPIKHIFFYLKVQILKKKQVSLK